MATKNGTCANPIPLKNVSDAQVIVVTPREMRLEVSDVLGRGGQNYLIFVRMLGAVNILRQPKPGARRLPPPTPLCQQMSAFG